MFGLKLCWLLMTLGMTGLFLYTGSGFALSLAVCLVALVLCALPVNLIVRNKLRVTVELPVNLRKGEPGTAVLEVKFNDFLPGYLAEVLADIPKVNIAVSKYVLCLNTI